jgi:hypothetical protein
MKRRNPYGTIKKAISLPADLYDFAMAKSAQPPYRGKLSRYIQALIDKDKQDVEVSLPKRMTKVL